MTKTRHESIFPETVVETKNFTIFFKTVVENDHEISYFHHRFFKTAGV